VPASNHICYPLKDPTSGSTLFKVNNCTAPRRTAGTVSATAAEVEDARAERRSMAYRTRLKQESGVRGSSLFFALSPAMRAVNSSLQDLWDLGPTAAP